MGLDLATRRKLMRAILLQALADLRDLEEEIELCAPTD